MRAACVATVPGMEPMAVQTERFAAPKDAERLRRIFLRDHLASVESALALVRRMLKENRTHPLATLLGTVRATLRDDRAQLHLAARALRLRPSLTKVVGVKVGEKAGRLKLNGRLRSYSPLSRVVELESLLMLTAQRAAMWRILERHAQIEARLTVVDLRGRAELAEEQVRLLERATVSASVEAF